MRSITAVIACRDEEKNLAPTYEAVDAAIRQNRFQDHEILIVNDGSGDHTAEVADAIATQDSHVRVIHNPTSRGYGQSFVVGQKLSRMSYLTVVPGDNEIQAESIDAILGAVGRADVVTSYTENRHVRPLHRRVLSESFTFLMNSLFGARLRYYNGPNVYRTSQVVPLGVRATSFAFNAEAVVRLMRSGHSVVEVGIRLHPQANRRSHALRLRNVLAVVRDVAKLHYELEARPRLRRSMKEP